MRHGLGSFGFLVGLLAAACGSGARPAFAQEAPPDTVPSAVEAPRAARELQVEVTALRLREDSLRVYLEKVRCDSAAIFSVPRPLPPSREALAACEREYQREVSLVDRRRLQRSRLWIIAAAPMVSYMAGTLDHDPGGYRDDFRFGRDKQAHCFGAALVTTALSDIGLHPVAAGLATILSSVAFELGQGKASPHDIAYGSGCAAATVGWRFR